MPLRRCEQCVEHICKTCGETKPSASFYARKRSDGSLYHRTACIECVRAEQRAARAVDPEQFREYTRRYYREGGGRRKVKDSALRKKFGITIEQYEVMVEEQGGVCALCERPPVSSKGFHVDHDHETGRVRSLLCHHCNTALGNFRDDPDLLIAAAMYLVKHKEMSDAEQ